MSTNKNRIMGWKGTKEITRSKALQVIFSRLYDDSLTNDQIGLTLESLGFGDEPELDYFGHNFSVVDDSEANSENNL